MSSELMQEILEEAPDEFNKFIEEWGLEIADYTEDEMDLFVDIWKAGGRAADKLMTKRIGSFLESIGHLKSIGLPVSCYVKIPTGIIAQVTRGEMGYFPYAALEEETKIEINKNLKITKYQEEAMLHGSMFGWDTLAASPNYWKKQDGI